MATMNSLNFLKLLTVVCGSQDSFFFYDVRLCVMGTDSVFIIFLFKHADLRHLLNNQSIDVILSLVKQFSAGFS